MTQFRSALLLPLLLSCVANATLAGDGCAATVAYGNDPLQTLDVYRTERSNAPVVVFFHGGGWRTGDKSELAAVGRALAARGALFIAPNYRLAPASRFPAHIDDAASAVAWVAKHARACGGDPRRIVLGGQSAGAHLAALLATNPEHLRQQKVARRNIRGLLLLSGVFEVVPREGGAPEAFISSVFGPSKDVWRSASPLAHIESSKTALRRTPMIVAWGDREQALVIAESRNWLDKLAEHDIDASVVIIEGAGHAEVLPTLAARTELSEAVARMLTAAPRSSSSDPPPPAG